MLRLISNLNNMEPLSKFQVHEKYQEVFVPVVSALAAAHMILFHDQQGSPFSIILKNGYFIELCINFLFALFVFIVINLTSLTLDNFYAWERVKWSRLWLQFLLGIIGTMVLCVLVAATYIAKTDQEISETDFFDVVLWMILGYVVAINMYYNADAIAHWKFLGILPLFRPDLTAQKTEGAELDDKPGTKAAILRLLKKHDVQLFYIEKVKVFAKLSNGGTIEWNFRLITTLEILDPKLYMQVSRFHVIRRDAIADVYFQPSKEQVILTLKAPLNDVLHVGKPFEDRFNGWWYEAEE